MKIRLIFSVLLFILQTSIYGQVGSGEFFVEEFIIAMKNGNDLNNFIYYNDLYENNGNNVNFINFCLISDYDITQISEMEYKVDIDTGIGSKCIQITILLIEIDIGVYKIKPGKIIFNEYLNKNVIYPWTSKKTVC